jgi:ATP-dependent Clp protease, protease subunit
MSAKCPQPQAVYFQLCSMRIPILTEIGEWGFGMAKLDEMLQMMSDDDKSIELYVASPGGDVSEADKIYSKLLELGANGYTITAILAGEVASAASYLIMAASNISAYAHARLMIHNSWTWAEGNQHDLKEMTAHLEAIDNSMAAIYSSRSGLGTDEVLELMKNTTWMSAEDAKAKGFIDTVIEMKAAAMDVRKIAANWKKEQAKEDLEQTITNKIMGKFQNMVNAALKAAGIKAEIKAMDITLEDGNILRVDSETEDLVGKTAVLIDSEGNESTPPDGSHTDADGRVITTAEGVVTEVAEPAEDEATAALNARIAALEADLADATTALATATQAIEAQAKATTTQPAAKQRTAAAVAKVGAQKGKSDSFDIVGAYAASKGITRADAEAQIKRNQERNKK